VSGSWLFWTVGEHLKRSQRGSDKVKCKGRCHTPFLIYVQIIDTQHNSWRLYKMKLLLLNSLIVNQSFQQTGTYLRCFPCGHTTHLLPKSESALGQAYDRLRSSNPAPNQNPVTAFHCSWQGFPHLRLVSTFSKLDLSCLLLVSQSKHCQCAPLLITWNFSQPPRYSKTEGVTCGFFSIC
jgi:hypothetical protein